MFGSISAGDHVRLKRSHGRWMGSDVRRNAFGIVRETHYGLFSSDVTIELANGSGRIRVPVRDVRRTGGRGDGGAFKLARDWHRAKLFAGFLLAVPVALALARFLLAGGHPSELVIPVFTGAIDTFFALIFGPLGWLVVLALVVFFLRQRIGSR